VPHVVLTDDDELFRESLGLNLADEGYDVTSFSNGRETLAYLQEGGEAEIRLPGRFKVTPQIAGAIKAVPGVIQVEAA